MSGAVIVLQVYFYLSTIDEESKKHGSGPVSIFSGNRTSNCELQAGLKMLGE